MRKPRELGVLLAFAVALLCNSAFAAEVMPPAPDRYFNDYAHVVNPDTAGRLNAKLEDFEKKTSNQIVVAVFPKMESDSSVDDYATRVFQAWGVGQKKKDNGAVLFVFVNDHKMFIVTGYGLEGALPDALCKRIIDTEIVPAFKRGDYAAGLTAGVNAILLATQGEYKGTGATVREGRAAPENHLLKFLFSPFGFFLIFVLINLLFARRRGTVYSGRGMGSFAGGLLLGGLGGGGGGRGGGFSGGGGGGFSGGGGSSGGGGAGGSW